MRFQFNFKKLRKLQKKNLKKLNTLEKYFQD